ncbi:hypothetical protein V8G54_019521 [Vigna mungo]|uniref:Serine-threonine/tyrosine-protein kinase catalytic domain-containing protein n=1 Tax=Vigna mungo TaxID=3915 RepID=A0AAQ3NBY5_VIGMU
MFFKCVGLNQSKYSRSPQRKHTICSRHGVHKGSLEHSGVTDSSLTITAKSDDVYSFDIVLLEVPYGMRCFELLTTEREFMKRPVEEKVDPNIKGKIAPECWQIFINITQRCVKYEADERPTMGEVQVQLKHALLLQEQADITNIHGDYILMSKTVINLPEWEG